MSNDRKPPARTFGDLLREKPALQEQRPPAAAAPPKAQQKSTPEEVEQRLSGMARLADPDGTRDLGPVKVLRAYRKGGVLARLLKHFIVGEIEQRRQRPANDDVNWRRFVYCERVKQMTADERETYREGFETTRRGTKNCAELFRSDYALAAWLDTGKLGAKKSASNRYRMAYARAKKQYGWTKEAITARGGASNDIPSLFLNIPSAHK